MNFNPPIRSLHRRPEPPSRPGVPGRPLVIALVFLGATVSLVAGTDHRGTQFIGVDGFSDFNRSTNDSGEVVFTSPTIASEIDWDNLVVSWNVDLTASGSLKIEARAIHPDHATKYYTLGIWSEDPENHPRESVNGQKDSDGDVQTDTLVLQQPTREVRLRLTLRDVDEPAQAMKFVGLSFLDSGIEPAALPPNRNTWGKLIDVEERSQMPYPNADGWCSPTTLSMLLVHWSVKLDRPELNQTVPHVAASVYDPNWPGTGNWPFNTAYAGSFRGIRAYVTRLSDVSELEDWIAAGIPVGVSVCYNRLRGKSEVPSGHLVVCVGFTEDGDVIVNDPGTTLNVRKTFTRRNLIHAWAYSHNTVYLVYPESSATPKDRFGHWD